MATNASRAGRIAPAHSQRQDGEAGAPSRRTVALTNHSTNGAAPLAAAGGSRRAVFVISLICAAQFVLQLDFSVVNVALPSIQRELGMPAAELQWIVTRYALAFGSLLLAGARPGAPRSPPR